MKPKDLNLLTRLRCLEMGVPPPLSATCWFPGETVLNAKLLGSMVSRMPANVSRIEPIWLTKVRQKSAVVWQNLKFLATERQRHPACL